MIRRRVSHTPSICLPSLKPKKYSTYDVLLRDFKQKFSWFFVLPTHYTNIYWEPLMLDHVQRGKDNKQKKVLAFIELIL